MRIKAEIFCFLFVISVFGCSVCNESKCEISEIQVELLGLENSERGKKTINEIKDLSDDYDEFGIGLKIKTICESGGSCKPGYGGSEDQISSLQILLIKEDSVLDVSEKFSQLESYEQEFNNRKYIYFGNQKTLLFLLNSTLNAQNNISEFQGLDTGYDLNDFHFPFYFDKKLLNSLNGNEQLIFNLLLEDNTMFSDTLFINSGHQ